MRKRHGWRAEADGLGRVVGTPGCAPLAGALVEVWQADARGDYTQVTAGKKDDPGCLLRASLTTDAGGRYRFQTIVPGDTRDVRATSTTA